MLTGVVVSANNFLVVVVILYGVIWFCSKRYKIKNPAIGAPGSY
jgi:hypothetical protein